MHGIVQYDYKAFFLPYNFGHLYTWTFTISKIVTQASLVEISDKTFAVFFSFVFWGHRLAISFFLWSALRACNYSVHGKDELFLY